VCIGMRIVTFMFATYLEWRMIVCVNKELVDQESLVFSQLHFR
jgi:hypothetical protein